MNTTLDELQAAILALPHAQQARLTVRVLDRMQRSPEVRAAWVAEVQARVAELQGGTQRREAKALHCSFCGRSKNAVAKMISGPSVYICNECVDLCNKILADETSKQ